MFNRRRFLQMAMAVPATAAVSRYRVRAAPMRKQVKITDVKCMLVRGLFEWPLVRIETDAGITGIGEAYHGRGVKDVILGLRPLMIGEDPLDVDRLYTKMITATGGAGSIAGVTVSAISGVEIALWDTVGKILEAPVAKLLGGQYRKSVKAYWTRRPQNPMDPASCREFAAMLKSHPYGFNAIKCDFMARTGDPDEPYSRHWTTADLRRNATAFQNIRDAVGDDVDIAVHCHWEFDWPDALALARAVAPMKPAWLEDPMPPNFSESWVKLTAASPVPILQGENLYTRHGFQPFIVNQGCHIIQIDIPKAGGLLESKKIADLADLYYIPVNAHNVCSPIGTLASAHSAASMRDFRTHEFNVGYPPAELPRNFRPNAGSPLGVSPALALGSTEAWEKYAVYDRPFIKDSHIQLSDKPGLGVELNEDYVRAHLVEGEQWWG
jgi:L-alanine-DL-glutamate epimerase-like enolase superfamily enzyme